MSRSVKVTVPASTANLGAGCDCLGLAVSLYNTVVFRTAEAGLAVTIAGEGKELLPCDANNTVWLAAKRLWDEIGFTPATGYRIDLENGIPVGAGLGSSAAAILCGITAANHLAGKPLAPEEALTLAALFEGHPDNVAAAFLGGCVVAVMEGNRLKTLKFPVAEGLKVIAAVPDFNLPTASARTILPEVYARRDAVYNIGRAALLAGSFACGRYDLLQYGMQDRLYQPYRAPLIPGLRDVKEAALKAGALGAALSGAGPTVVALATGATGSIEAAMAEAFRRAGVGVRTLTLGPDNEGTRVEEM